MLSIRYLTWPYGCSTCCPSDTSPGHKAAVHVVHLIPRLAIRMQYMSIRYLTWPYRCSTCPSDTSPGQAAHLDTSWSGQCWSRWSLVIWAELEQVFTGHACSVGSVHWSCVQCWNRCSLVVRAVLEVFTGHVCSVGTGVHWSCVQCWNRCSLVMCAVLEVFTGHEFSVGTGVHWSCMQC